MKENSKILEYRNALLIGFSEFFICFFLFCFGLLFSILILCFAFSLVDGGLLHASVTNPMMPTRSTLSWCSNPYQQLQARKKGTSRNEIERKTEDIQRTFNMFHLFILYF
uniref:Uncharacterized protein n=1 Tax=Leptospira santarosai serovar Arenal str. MAVJ 401 TaxID=1049976 RepID=M6JS01_9LEPT|nr:hypothetical protein LEP1GSC063_1265 [Leptospira santarosai serovar Arenal str. MAVJ 401]